MFGLGPATRIYLAPEHGHAQRLRWSVRLVRDPIVVRASKRASVLVCNARLANRLKVLGLGRQWTLDLFEKIGEGVFQLDTSGDAQGKVVLSHEELSYYGWDRFDADEEQAVVPKSKLCRTCCRINDL